MPRAFVRPPQAPLGPVGFTPGVLFPKAPVGNICPRAHASGGVSCGSELSSGGGGGSGGSGGSGGGSGGSESGGGSSGGEDGCAGSGMDVPCYALEAPWGKWQGVGLVCGGSDSFHTVRLAAGGAIA